MFIGHTRFSLLQPGSSRWRASEEGRFAGIADYRDYLYSDRRMNARIDIFLGMTVPQLAVSAQDQDVYHIVSYSEELPVKYKRQLLEAAQEHSFLILDECTVSDPPLLPLDLAKKLHGEREVKLFAEYRLDDDDVLPRDYFERLEPYLDSSFLGMYVSFGEGLTGIYDDGHFYDVRRCRVPMIAIGLAKICGFGSDGELIAPATTRHTISDTVAPVILDSRKLGYIWARHPEQDTAVSVSFSNTREELFERARRQIDRYPVEDDMQQVAEQFPVVQGRLHTDIAPGLRQIPLVRTRTRLPSNGVSVDAPSFRGRCHFDITTRAGTLKPGRDVLLAFKLQDSTGTPLSVSSDGAKMKEAGLIYSRWTGVGFCRWIATRPGLRREEFTIELPSGIEIVGLTLFPRRDLNARLEVEQFTVIAAD